MRRVLILMVFGTLWLTARASADLIGHWALDEGSGTTFYDSSQYGNDGTIDPWNASQIDWTTEGHSGSALAFTTLFSNHSYAQAALPDGLLDTSEATVGFWMKMPVAHQAWGVIIDLVGTTNDYSLEGIDTGAVYLYSPWFGDDGSPLNDNQWHYLTLTTNSGDGQAKIYIDGTEAASSAFTASEAITAVRIGGPRQYASVWANFNGVLDEVALYNETLTADDVKLLYQRGPSTAPKAKSPTPSNGEEDVFYKALELSWSCDLDAPQFDVYVGTDFNDVNDATRTNPLNVLISQAQDANTLSYGDLAFSQTYYWRVDEVNGAPDHEIYKGAVWSFTAEPYSRALPSAHVLTATTSSNYNKTSGAHTIDESGLTGDEHSTELADQWLATGTTAWIQYELDRVYRLDQMKVWNSNTETEMLLGEGIKDLAIAYSLDGQTWTELGRTQLDQASGTDDYTGQLVGLGITARYVKLTGLSSFGGLPFMGLSEVRFYYVPTYAGTPKPENEATDAGPDMTLAWRPGREAASHAVYLGTDAEILNLLGTVSSPAFDTTDLALSYDQTYYWQVVEINEAGSLPAYAGDVWSFTTPEYKGVDDFEAYGNASPNRPFQTWIDGLGYSKDDYLPGNSGNGSGASIGHDIWSLSSAYFGGLIMETATVAVGSLQSMPFYYDNTGSTGKALYSQIDRTFATAQNWIQGGLEVLSLSFYGNPNNSVEPLSLTIGDGKAKVTVQYPDNSALAEAGWHTWTIALTECGSVDLTQIKTLSLRVGGTTASQAGGSGLLLIDDIRLGRAPDAGIQSVAVANASFELPGTVKQTGFGSVPGWSTDGTVSDSGVESANTSDGVWYAYLMSGDPSIWQLTDHVIQAGETFELSVDALITYQATTLRMILYYDNNGTRVPVAEKDVTLKSTLQTFSLDVPASDVSDAIGHPIGIELLNSTSGSTWLGVDNVRLTVKTE